MVEPLLQLQLLDTGLKLTLAGPMAFHVYVKLLLPPGQLAPLPLRVAVRFRLFPTTTVVDAAAGGSIVTVGCWANKVAGKARDKRVLTPLLKVEVFMLKRFLN